MRYELSDIVDMLDIQRPLLKRPVVPDEPNDPSEPFDPFAEFAARYGFKAPIDVEQRLAAMVYMGDGDSGIHQTQLSCSASLVAQGQATDDEIVTSLLSATRAAAGHSGLYWNWKREEKALRRMVETARAKFGSRPPRKTPPDPPANPPPDPPGNHGGGGELPPPGGGRIDGTTGEIVDLDGERKQRRKLPPPKPGSKDAPLIARLGDAVIAYWQDTHGPLISTGMGLSTYSTETGVWTHFDDDLDLQLRVACQGIFAAAGAKPQIATLNAVLRYVKERPALHQRGVQWDASGFVVCPNCCVNVTTREVREHTPELYMTWRIDCDYDEQAACPKFFHFLAWALRDMPPEEVKKAVETLGEHMGASLVRRKPRNLRKAMLIIGQSRSGKTTIAHIYRALLGGKERLAGMKLSDLEDKFFATELVSSAGWVADDVAGQRRGRRYNEAIDGEKLKTIITGEPMSIRMPGGYWTRGELDIPVALTMNSLPKIDDDSNGVYNRILMLPLNQYWPEDAPNPDPRRREMHQVLVQDELSAILNFAIHSYARLKERGHYDPPAAMTAAIDQLRENNQPLVTWMQECIVLNENTQIDNRDLMGSLRGWWLQQFDDERIPGGRTVQSVLKQHFPAMQQHKSHGQRISAGIALTEDGIACLRYAKETAPYGSKVGSDREPLQANNARSKF